MAAPAVTEPLPAGSTAPSGAMVMSSFRTSSGVNGRPSLGPSAPGSEDNKNSAGVKKKTALRVYIFHRPIGLDAPGANAGVMVELARRILRQPRGSRRLHVA